MEESFLFTNIDFQADDLSIWSFGDDITATIGSYHRELDTTTTTSKPCSSIEIDATKAFAPSVSDDDESISGRSLFSSGLTLHSSNDDPSSASEKPPSFGIMVSKLNSMMMKSAKSRAIISNTVFAELKKKARKISLDCTSTNKPSLHKASRQSPKHSHQNKDNISTDSIRLGSRQDSNIGGFLRASKKW